MASGAAPAPRGLIATMALAAGTPLVLLLALFVAGVLPLAPALLGGAMVLTWAAGLAYLWRRDLETLAADLARLRRARDAEAAALSRRAGREAEILALLPDPLILLDAEGAALRANPAAGRLFGDDLPALLRHPALRGAIGRVVASGAAESVALAIAVPLPRALEATVLPLPGAGPERAVAVIADRTQAEAVERMRADFVANVSHELRNPLASLIGFIDTLRGAAADDPAAQARFLAIMAEQGARMSRLIDDLLALSRIEANEHQPPAERIDLAALLARARAGFEPRLSAGGPRLALDLAAPLPQVAADADQIMQVLQNLLENALKYGAEGGEIRLSAEPVAAGGAPWPGRAGVVFAVADRGPGIAPEHLPRLTERFYRVDKGRSRAMGGTGLGLAIVKHIISRHRGLLRIESAEGQGTVVRVFLPAA